MPVAQPSSARVREVVAGAVAAGLMVREVRVEKDGALRVITDRPDAATLDPYELRELK